MDVEEDLDCFEGARAVKWFKDGTPSVVGLDRHSPQLGMRVSVLDDTATSDKRLVL